MKKRLFKFISVILASAFCAGAFALCAFSAKLPKDTFVNGVKVGGITRTNAVKAVRADIVKMLESNSLTVHSGKDIYVFTYPEISFKDNAPSVINGITKSGSYNVTVRYYLNGAESIVSGICAAGSQIKREPCAIFNPMHGVPFEYEKGVKGVYCDKARLAYDINQSLKNGFSDVYLHTREFSPAKNMKDVMQSTVLLSSFTTYYDANNVPRSQNIALAAKRISGEVIPVGGTFSFNRSVGPRTKERGFRIAKVIEGGRYVYGTGGGVCQVSTTLYNAALLAGLKITEYHPHSLPVSYVSPSRDAMVSGLYYDLSFKNITDCPVYIRVLTGKGYVKCEVYGKSDGYVYSLSSELLDSDDGGVRSRCLISGEKDGYSYTEVLRTDRYLPCENGNILQ